MTIKEGIELYKDDYNNLIIKIKKCIYFGDGLKKLRNSNLATSLEKIAPNSFGYCYTQALNEIVTI